MVKEASTRNQPSRLHFERRLFHASSPPTTRKRAGLAEKQTGFKDK
jgi:hypothetical protein